MQQAVTLHDALELGWINTNTVEPDASGCAVRWVKQDTEYKRGHPNLPLFKKNKVAGLLCIHFIKTQFISEANSSDKTHPNTKLFFSLELGCKCKPICLDLKVM